MVSIYGQMTLTNCLEHVIYNGSHITIVNNTAKDLVFKGAGMDGAIQQYYGQNRYKVITQVSDAGFRVVNNQGGDVIFDADIVTKEFEAEIGRAHV